MQPKMNWTFMSLQILDDVRRGKLTFAEMFPRARAAGFVAYDASDSDAEFAPREEVLRLRDVFGGNLIVSASHEEILPNIPIENMIAMARAAKE